MRSARLISADRLAVVLVAHGSRDPRAAAATEALARAVRRARPRWDVRAAYLDHAGPRPLDVLAALRAPRAVLVPLLLTNAYHGRVDIPAVLDEAAALPLTVTVTLADVLGPARPVPARDPLGSTAPRPAGGAGMVRPVVPAFGLAGGTAASRPAAPGGVVPALLIDALVRRLPGALDGVVLAAAGTRDAAARTTVEWAAEALSARLSLPCAVAYASAAPPRAGAAVDLLRAAGCRRVGVAAYFLAPGRLYDLAMDAAREAGAVAVADPLGDAPELVGLVTCRVDTAVVQSRAAA
jgi:sirohydrochlorin ferrochelatase